MARSLLLFKLPTLHPDQCLSGPNEAGQTNNFFPENSYFLLDTMHASSANRVTWSVSAAILNH